VSAGQQLGRDAAQLVDQPGEQPVELAADRGDLGRVVAGQQVAGTIDDELRLSL
jgi:hypothetical protein